MGEWSEKEFERAKKLVLVDGLSGDRAASALNREFHNNRTRCSVIGKLTRHGIKISLECPERNSRQVFAGRTRARRVAAAPKPRPVQPAQKVTKGFHTTTNGTQKPDISIRSLLKGDKTRVPPEGAQGYVHYVDGKIHANPKMGARACQYSEVDPLKHQDCFCAKETVAAGIPWCPTHFAIVYPGASVEKARQKAKAKVFEVVE